MSRAEFRLGKCINLVLQLEDIELEQSYIATKISLWISAILYCRRPVIVLFIRSTSFCWTQEGPQSVTMVVVVVVVFGVVVTVFEKCLRLS